MLEGAGSAYPRWQVWGCPPGADRVPHLLLDIGGRTESIALSPGESVGKLGRCVVAALSERRNASPVRGGRSWPWAQALGRRTLTPPPAPLSRAAGEGSDVREASATHGSRRGLLSVGPPGLLTVRGSYHTDP